MKPILRATIPILANILLSVPLLAQGTGMLISDARIDAIKRRVLSHTEPTASAYEQCEEKANAELDRDCQAPDNWYVPLRYVNNEAHQAAKKCLHDDANIAFKLALVYRVSGDEKYAVAAARLINGWATKVKTMSTADDSRISFNYHFPALIFAADLIRTSPHFPQADQDRFGAFLKRKALPMNIMARVGNKPALNGNDWGLLIYLSTALYLHDEGMVNTALQTYKEYIGMQITPEGILPQEITRNNSTGDAGYWYINFALMPLTISTELFRLHGVDLYDYASPTGSSLHKAYEKTAALMEKPGDYPFGTVYKGKAPHSLDDTFYAGYMEILNTRWPNAEVTTVLNAKRPWDPDHSLPVTTLLYGDLVVHDGPSATATTGSADDFDAIFHKHGAAGSPAPSRP